MRLIKPNWVHHDEKPIFSIDIHQDGKKFATGGQGNDSGRIVIWNMQPVLHKNVAENRSVPKILCTMDSHLACVNCVRWSQNGELLASGSDDKLVMIWRKAKGPSGLFGTGGLQINLESWKCIATLRGHSGDVLDLAWSPQDVWLASCSVDNSISIWDTTTFTLVATLREHTGLVKGITWDPVGKYLASQSDDRTVKIWNTSDWTCVQTITEPFEDCGGTTHILRLSWSPDGQYLVSAHAMNSGGPTAQIIEREAWKCDKDFVGHRKAVTCVRFHDSLIKRKGAKNAKPLQCCCLAIGSRDRSLSVWMTASQRPLAVVHDLFADSVLDLSWGVANYVLLACSNDGRVAGLQFEEREFGLLLPEEEKMILYQRVYGQSALMKNGTANGTDEIVENAENLLNLSQEKITPPTVNTIQAIVEQSSDDVSKSFNLSVIDSPAKLTSSNMNGGIVHSSAHNSSFSILPQQVISQQKETRTADGKRRIVPVFIPTNQDASETPAAPQPANVTKPTQANLNTVTSSINSTNGTTTALPIATISSITSQKSDSNQSKNEANLLNRLDPRLSKSVAARLLPKTPNAQTLHAFPSSQGKDTWAKGSTASYQGTSAAPLRGINSNTICTISKANKDYRMQVENGAFNSPDGMVAKVTMIAANNGDKTLWEIFVGSPVVNFNLCSQYAMICCFDGTLLILDIKTALLIWPPHTLGSNSTQCGFSSTGRYVGVITECGLVQIWDMIEQSVFLATTCNLLLQKYGNITQFEISDQGIPFISFQYDASFCYSTKLQTWFVLSIRNPMIRYAASSTMPKKLKRDYNSYPVLSAHSMSSSFASGVNAKDSKTTEWHSYAKIAFCESQIKLCEQLNSPLELKHFYQTLAYQIATCGDEKRLRLHMNDLLGIKDVDEEAADLDGDDVCNQDPKILSISKLELFEDMLKVIQPHTKWQRVYQEYKSLYELQKQRMSNVVAANVVNDNANQEESSSNDSEMMVDPNQTVRYLNK